MSWRVEILGVRLMGVDNLAAVEIPLQPGLTAFVGQNGAGKTRILEALQCALSGSGSQGRSSHILFKVVRGDPDARTADLLPIWGLKTTKTLTSDGEQDVLTHVRSSLGEHLSDIDAYFSDDPNSEFDVNTDALESLLASGVLAWVQLNKQPPFLCAAADPSLEGASQHFYSRFREFIELSLDTWGPEFDTDGSWIEGSLSHLFALDHPLFQDQWLPEESDPSGWGDTLPVPLFALRNQPTPFTGIKVDSTEANTSMDLVSEFLVRSHLVKSLRRLQSVDTDEISNLSEFSSTEWPPSFVQEHSAAASKVFARLFPGAPRLECRVHDFSRLLFNENSASSWWAEDSASGKWVSISHLSGAEQRWARFSIDITAPFNDSSSLYLLDEPERGLHRSLEHNFASTLREITDKGEVAVAVATHSPLIMAAANHVLEVNRDEHGGIRVTPITANIMDRMESTGLIAPDKLSLARGILLLEGHHDELIVGAYLSETLQTERIIPLTIGGVKNRSEVVTAEVITQFVDLPIVILVDGLGRSLQEKWQAAQEFADQGKKQKAGQILQQIQYEHRGHEGSFVAAAGRILLKQGRMNNLSIVSLDVPDILDLLPCEAFVPGCTWEQLRNDHLQKGKNRQSFKEYLKQEHSVHFSDRKINQAIWGPSGSADSIPRDLIHLQEVLETIAPHDAMPWTQSA